MDSRGRRTTVHGGRPWTAVDGGRPWTADGRGRWTAVDGGRPWMADGGRPWAADGRGRRTAVHGGRPWKVDGRGRPEMQSSRRTAAPRSIWCHKQPAAQDFLRVSAGAGRDVLTDPSLCIARTPSSRSSVCLFHQRPFKSNPSQPATGSGRRPPGAACSRTSACGPRARAMCALSHGLLARVGSPSPRASV